MLLVEIAGGIILASMAMAYWRQALMVLILLTMLSSVLLAVLK